MTKDNAALPDILYVDTESLGEDDCGYFTSSIKPEWEHVEYVPRAHQPQAAIPDGFVLVRIKPNFTNEYNEMFFNLCRDDDYHGLWEAMIAHQTETSTK